MSTRVSLAAMAALAFALGGCTVEQIEVDPTDDAAPAPGPVSINCNYPAATGVSLGNVLPQINWTGYVAGEAEPREFNSAELYQCDGSGYHAVLYQTAQYG